MVVKEVPGDYRRIEMPDEDKQCQMCGSPHDIEIVHTDEGDVLMCVECRTSFASFMNGTGAGDDYC